MRLIREWTPVIFPRCSVMSLAAQALVFSFPFLPPTFNGVRLFFSQLVHFNWQNGVCTLDHRGLCCLWVDPCSIGLTSPMYGVPSGPPIFYTYILLYHNTLHIFSGVTILVICKIKIALFSNNQNNCSISIEL